MTERPELPHDHPLHQLAVLVDRDMATDNDPEPGQALADLGVERLRHLGVMALELVGKDGARETLAHLVTTLGLMGDLANTVRKQYRKPRLTLVDRSNKA